MKEDLVEIKEVYNGEGVLIELYYDNVQQQIPLWKKDHPSIVFFDSGQNKPDTCIIKSFRSNKFINKFK